MSPEEIKGMSGLEVLTAISDGRIDHPSMAHTLDFRLTEVEEGRAVIEGTTGPDYCNPNGTIHGAWPAALLDSCMGSAVHSTLPPGTGFTIVEVKIDFVRSITIKTGHVRAEGKVVRVGKQVGQSDGVIYDDRGVVLAKGSATCLLFPARDPASPED
ncbi:MAG: hotdog fold thioesterase [Woeseiaceae bacterium]|nr:hotdog fold thioesterase [Woeseiaceae bacterium]